MKVVLDLQTLQSKSRDRGIGRYSRGLATALFAQQSDADWSALFNLKMDLVDHRELSLPGTKVHYFDSLRATAGMVADNAPRAKVAELIRDAYVQARHADLVHIASPFDGFRDDTIVGWGRGAATAIAATVYDFIPFEDPAKHFPDQAAARWYQKRLDGLKSVDVVLAISDHTKSMAQVYLKLPADRVVNVSADVSSVFRPIILHADDKSALLDHYGITKPFILHTGIFEERKNVRSLLEAFARFPSAVRDGHQIVLVAPSTEDQRQKVRSTCRQLGISEASIVLAGFVPDADLARLYTLARVTVMPSFAEGFGLPLLEAMRCGCPVLGSNVTSIPEVVGAQELLFDPHDPGDLAQKLLRVLTDNPFRAFALKHAGEQQKRFSWQSSAQRAAEAFAEAVARRQPLRSLSKPKATLVAGDSQKAFRDIALHALHSAADTNDAELRTEIETVGGASAAGSLLDILSRGPTFVVVNSDEVGGDGCALFTKSDHAAMYRLFGWRALDQTTSQFSTLTDQLSASNIVAVVRHDAASSDWSVRTGATVREVPTTALAAVLEGLWRESPLATLAEVLPQIQEECRTLGLSLREIVSVAIALANNHPAAYARRLFVDISELRKHDAKSGVQRVVRNIVRRLVQLPSAYRVEPVYRDGGVYRYARAFFAQVVDSGAVGADAVVDFQPRDVFLGLDLDLLLVEEAAKLLAIHQRRGLVVVHVIYDMLPLERPEWFVEGMSDYFASWLSFIGPISDAFICISKATGRALERQLGQFDIAREKPLVIRSFPLGADLDGRSDLAATPKPQNETQQRIMLAAIGTIEPRKGHEQILDAFEILWSQGFDIDLTFVGRYGWGRDGLRDRMKQHPEAGGRFQWHDNASDADLATIYRNCSGLLVASEGEGYGLPVIEAKLHGKPTIVRDLEVFREVAGDDAYFFNAQSADELASAIREWVGLFQTGKLRIAQDLTIATWEDSAATLLRVIDDVARA